MEVEITTIKENPLMDRREVEATVKHENEATPSKEDVLSRLAADRGLDKENVNVRHVYTGYGRQKSRAIVQITEEFEYDENLLEETIDQQETSEDAETASEYTEIVSGTISDAKETLKEMDEPDFEAALEAEKSGKNRTTLVDWLESQTE